MNQPLNVTISRTADGTADYMQIMSADLMSVNPNPKIIYATRA